MRQYRHILIDLNNLFWRNVCVCGKACIEDEDLSSMYSEAVQATLNKIKSLKNDYGYQDSFVYLLKDNPFSKIDERKSIDSNYKNARRSKNVPAAFHKSLEHLAEILKCYDDTYRVCSYDNCEADDLVKIVLNGIEGTVLLVSADLDWARGINFDTDWYNFVEVISAERFIELYGFTPIGNSLKMYKAIHGDRSDSIENAVPHLPKDILIDLVSKYNTVDEMMRNMWNENYPEKWKLRIKENEVQIKINYQLVDYLDLPLSYNQIVYNCKENIGELRSWFGLLDLPLEPRMIDIKNDAKSFFKQKKLKRITRY
ncbi:MAG: hypothetical protein BWY64_02837 [bacterium ADurb.Bin363]|nr:MAG: hypothetical protein BWY64_02837 [bacterium ADurb.Bin363]